MQLHTVLFEVERKKGMYSRLARALERSVWANSPSTPIVVHHVRDNDDDLQRLGKQCKATYIDNARKTKHHARIVQEAYDDQLLCLIDCDTLVLSDLSSLSAAEFDFAYTIRPPDAKYPFNSGVVFVRVSPRMRLFYRLWYEVVQELLQDPVRLMQKRRKYGGINQCGLAHVLAAASRGIDGLRGIDVEQLPCFIWNCDNTSWKSFGADTKIVHLVPTLREYCVRGSSTRSSAACSHPNFVTIRDAWRSFDQQEAVA